MSYNPQDVEILIRRVHGRCKAAPQYGTMLPVLIEQCMKSKLPIFDIGMGYYTSVVLHYLFGDRVTSLEAFEPGPDPRIVSYDGMDRRIEPSWLIPGSIWVLHDMDDEYCQQAVSLLTQHPHSICQLYPRTLVARIC